MRSKLITAALLLAGTLAICTWVCGARSDLSIQDRIPGADKPVIPQAAAGAQKIEGHLSQGTGAASAEAGSWPQFRGPAGTGISTEDVPLARQWPKDGPKRLWTISAGDGYAGPVVLNGRVYLTDYDTAQRRDAIRCLSLADGAEIWRYAYPIVVKRNHGMSRTTPAVTGKHLVALGPKCHVTCLDANSGALRWNIDLVKDYKTTVPQWYAGQCPLIEGERAILAPGGADCLMMAVECATGSVIWKTLNPRRWAMTHVSILPIEFKGKRMYVYCGSGGVAGVSAEDGALLWETDAWRIAIATVATPVWLGGGRLFFSGGYNAGCLMLQLKETAGKFETEVLWRKPEKEFGAVQQTPIFFQDHIYGVRPDGQLACLDTDGKVLWTSGARQRFGLGAYLLAQGVLYLVNDDGLMTAAEALPGAFSVLAQAKVLNGPECWGPLALAGGRLLVRDLTHLTCLDLREASGSHE